MSKEAFNTKKFTGFFFDPEDIEIVTDKNDPLYDDRVSLPLEESFVKNIMFYGVKQPITITKRGDSPVVVAGRQRVRAAIEANKRLSERGMQTMQVPCRYERGTDESLFETMVMENEQRRDDSPIEKAQKIARMLSFGKTEDDAAMVFGVSKQTIKQWLELLSLPRDVRDKIDTGEIRPTNALKARKMPEKMKRKTLNPSRMKKKKSICAKAEEIKTWQDDEYRRGFENALRWVLGE